MIVLGVAATRNQLCPSRSIRDAPSSRFSMTAPRSSQASAFMVSRTRNSASSNASGTRVRAKLLVTDCDHLGDRLGDPGRHAGKIDGRGCRRAGYWHGNAPDVGLLHTASYRLLRYGASPPSPARPCRRDKILPWDGRLSRNPVSGRPFRQRNRATSITYVCHTRPTPDPHQTHTLLTFQAVYHKCIQFAN